MQIYVVYLVSTCIFFMDQPPFGLVNAKSTCQLYVTYNLQILLLALNYTGITSVILTYFSLTSSFCHCLAKGKLYPYPLQKIKVSLSFKFYPLHPFGNSSFASYFPLISLDLKLFSPSKFFMVDLDSYETVHFLQILWLE